MMRWGLLLGMLLGVPLVAGCEINPLFDPEAIVGTGSGGSDSGSGEGGDDVEGPIGQPGVPLPDPCPALSAPTGEIINVGPDQAPSLPAIVSDAPQGSTVVLSPGTYVIDRAITFSASDVTLRSSTGRPEDVIIDGANQINVVVFIYQPRTTLAELTLTRSTEHLVHISGSATDNANGAVGYRLRLIDAQSSAFKVNPSYEEQPADDGILACSSITLTDAAREALMGDCSYTGGMAGIATFGWTVRDNVVEGLWCPTGFASSAIRFFETSAYNTIERNVIRDCTQGIILGVYEDAEPRRDYPSVPCGAGYFDHVGGVVRNNMVIATGTGIAASEVGFDTGIGLWNVCDATVVHNTVVSAVDTYNSIEYRFSRTQARVVNNLVTNEILDRDDAGVPVAGNAIVELNEFVDPLGGDVHLIEGSTAIDGGIQLGDDAVLHDIDGDPRDDRPDIGADER